MNEQPLREWLVHLGGQFLDPYASFPAVAITVQGADPGGGRSVGMCATLADEQCMCIFPSCRLRVRVLWEGTRKRVCGSESVWVCVRACVGGCVFVFLAIPDEECPPKRCRGKLICIQRGSR